MKPLSEQDHYETLEVPRDAERDEIERAYRLAQATYSADSLAGYSVFDDGDLELLQERIELAYRTLADPEARSAYDRDLAERESTGAGPWGGDATREDTPRAGAGGDSAPDAHAASGGSRASQASAGSFDGFDDDGDEETEWDGGRLRRTRLRSGIEIQDIAKTTKVNPTYLECIEEERFAELPATVYTRGFVMGYASCLGLDARRVAASYMQRFEESREARRRRLFSRG